METATAMAVWRAADAALAAARALEAAMRLGDEGGGLAGLREEARAANAEVERAMGFHGRKDGRPSAMPQAFAVGGKAGEGDRACLKAGREALRCAGNALNGAMTMLANADLRLMRAEAAKAGKEGA